MRNRLFNIEILRNSGLFFILVLGMILLLLGLNRVVIYDDAINIDTPTLTGFEEVNKGVLRSNNGKNEFHQFAALIPLVPNTYYRIQYDISELAWKKVTLTTDLYAPGYDNSKQEFRIVLGMNELGEQQDVLINSGQSPEQAHFRLFYSGAPGLEIKNIQITKIATWSIWLQRALLTGGIGLIILVLYMFVIKHIRNLNALSQTTENTISKIIVIDVLPVMAIYLIAVIIRYVMYIAMPYWSGDEYVYKSIAAGIWQYGHHGVVTEAMVSHSVDLPNLLYPYLISPAFMLGENFYFGVRLINAIVMNMAIFPCYLIARKYLNRTPALLASGFAIAIPFLNIGAFAVTEVLFFPLFMFAIWVAIESISRPQSVSWFVAFGFMVAVLLNVKLNALVLLPAFFVSLLWLSILRKQVKGFFIRPYWLSVVLSFLCTYFLLQYFLFNRRFGDAGAYTKIAELNEGFFSTIFNNFEEVGHLVIGHMTTLAIPYALPIVLIIYVFITNRNKWYMDKSFNDFLVVVVFFSSAIFALTLLFTIKVSPVDLGGLGRWHSRYYFYFYPLVIIAGAVFVEHFKFNEKPNRLVVLGGVALLLVVNIYFIKYYNVLKNPWFGSIVDNMDVQWYRYASQFYWLFIVFTAILSWLWVKRSEYFKRSLIYFMITWVLVANYGTLRVTGAGRPSSDNACGNLSQHFLEKNPGRFVVVGDSRANMVSAAFWNIYIPVRAFIYSDTTNLFSSAVLGVSTDYLIVNGDIQVDTTYNPLISNGECTIYEQQK